MSQDTIILLLQHLRFAIEKSQFDPRTEIEFLGLKINPVKDHSYMSSTRKGKGVSFCRILISFVFLVSFFVFCDKGGGGSNLFIFRLTSYANDPYI